MHTSRPDPLRSLLPRPMRVFAAVCSPRHARGNDGLCIPTPRRTVHAHPCTPRKPAARTMLPKHLHPPLRAPDAAALTPRTPTRLTSLWCPRHAARALIHKHLPSFCGAGASGGAAPPARAAPRIGPCPISALPPPIPWTEIRPPAPCQRSAKEAPL
jgi:hypothetical protein